jgi:hypothetical protein
MYQCAETQITARGLGIEAAMDRHPSAYGLGVMAFIGFP